ncbi:MAG: hypothetical protein FP811_05110 [Desulfobacteraceae bacterium]|nr:hypothetical protein [Desulfobacteraceae bacterium]MBU4126749.1 four helix bundle protein [Pseudomonadota bacterium]
MPKEVDAIIKLYDFFLWIIPKLEKFPHSKKFLIADRIEAILLDVIDLLIEAAYSKPGLVATRRTSGRGIY